MTENKTSDINGFPEKKSSKEIRVNDWELILQVPFVIRDAKEGRGDRTSGHSKTECPFDWLDEIVSFLEKGCKWKEQKSVFPADSNRSEELPLDAMREYSEFVYFHPFARSFLYANRGDIRASRTLGSAINDTVVNRNIRLLARTDLTKLNVTWYDEVLAPGSGYVTATFRCDECKLHLFDTKIGILSLRITLESPQEFTLRHVLSCSDYIRRLYAPFWMALPFGCVAGKCPSSIEFVFDSKHSVAANYGTTTTDDWKKSGTKAIYDQLAKVRDDREPWMAPTWTALLAPLVSRKLDQDAKHAFEYSQIEDERAQVMSRLSVEGVNSIQQGDWVRLANLDDAGNSKQYPYSPKFIDAGDFESMAYDRFWDDRYWDPEDNAKRNPGLCNLRWLCSGYAFSAVSDASNTFFHDEQNGIPVHFRQHYFKLYMIALMHHATLLNFKQRISNSLDYLRSGEGVESRDAVFAQDILEIDHDFLKFRNNYWFEEVTNQIQGRQMFDWISKHLGTRSLFSQVREEVRDAVSHVQSRQMVDSVKTIEHMQTNIEWVEIFIIGVYAIELPVAISHLFNLHSPWYAWISVLLAVISIVVVSLVSSPWEHDDANKPSLLRTGAMWLKTQLARRVGNRLHVLSLLGVTWMVWLILAWWFLSSNGHSHRPADSTPSRIVPSVQINFNGTQPQLTIGQHPISGSEIAH